MTQPGRLPSVQVSIADDDLKAASGCIERAKNDNDYVFVSVHWGVAFEDQFADYQQLLGRAMVDSGADFVVGHHPHAIQPIEFYQGGYIFYSLGNFIFHHLRETPTPEQLSIFDRMSCDAIAVRLTLSKTGPTRVEVIPLQLNKHGMPGVGGAPASRELLERLRRWSASLGVRIMAKDNIGVVESK